MKRHLIKKEDAKRAYETNGGETQHTFKKAGKGRYVCVYMFVHLWFSGEAWVLSKHKHAGQRDLDLDLGDLVRQSGAAGSLITPSRSLSLPHHFWLY